MKHLKIDNAIKEKITKDMNALLDKHNKYIGETGQDIPEVLNWKWND